MNWTMIVLAAGLTALGLALVLLAVYLRRSNGDAEVSAGVATPEPESLADAFIDEPLETDMSAVLLGSAPFSATGTSPAVDLTVDRSRPPDMAGEPAETLDTWEPRRDESQLTPEWEESIPASLFEAAAPETAEPLVIEAEPFVEAEAVVENAGMEPQTVDVDISPEELEEGTSGQALARLGPPLGDYSRQLRRDAPVIGAAAGIAVAAGLIGYAVGRRRKKSS